MARYINADLVLELFKDVHPLDYNANAYVQQIKKLPTADVKPIVYGNWVSIDDEPHEDFECDKCGYIIYGEEFATNFCPNCGAKMKGVEE